MSRFFSWDELACKDGAPYPTEWRGTRGAELLALADALREAWGGPLVVVSGYRSPAHNKAIGGALHSQHVEGRALDLRPAPQNGETMVQACRRMYRMIDRMHDRGEVRVGGLGRYVSFCHVDTRPHEIARWAGKTFRGDMV